MLGEVVITPTAEHERPEIQTITLDPSETNALLAAYRQGNFLWAHRQGHRRRPQKGYPLPRNDGDVFTFRPAGDLLDERATPRLAALRRAGVAMEDELHGECSLAPTQSPCQRRDRLGIRDAEVAVRRRRNGRVRPSLTVPGGVNREPLTQIFRYGLRGDRVVGVWECRGLGGPIVSWRPRWLAKRPVVGGLSWPVRSLPGGRSPAVVLRCVVRGLAAW